MKEKQIDEFKVIDRKKESKQEKVWYRELVKDVRNRPKTYGLGVAVVLVMIVVIAYVVPAVSYVIEMRGKTKVSLFEHVQVVFAGMSPEAYVLVQNNWEDEYLQGLQFSADRSTGIVTGETVTITCQTSAEEMKEHGYVPDMTTATFKADKLSAYAESMEQVDKNYLQTIADEATATIISETEDTTFRMLYKATNDAAFLRTVNDESAENIHREQTLFLSQKNSLEGDGNNYIVMIFSGEISNQETTMPVYFAFTYRDGYVTSDGTYEIDHDQQKDKYQCNADYDTLYTNALGIYDGLYDVTEIVQ